MAPTSRRLHRLPRLARVGRCRGNALDIASPIAPFATSGRAADDLARTVSPAKGAAVYHPKLDQDGDGGPPREASSLRLPVRQRASFAPKALSPMLRHAIGRRPERQSPLPERIGLLSIGSDLIP